MRCLVLCAALFAAGVPRVVGAQSISLTESDALARLSVDSPRVRAIRAAIDVARADVIAAGRRPNPVVSVNRESVAGVTEYLTTVTLPLSVSGQRGFQIQAASALVAAEEARANETLRQARAALRTAFSDLNAAQTRERELTAARDRLRDLAGILAKRESAGDAAGFDRLRAEREVLDIEADLALAAADRAKAQGILAGFFSESIEISRLVATSVPSTAAIPTIDDLIQKAETSRGDLIALQREVEAARFSLRAADRRVVPEPSITAGTKSSNALGGDVGGILSVQFTVPLFDRGQPERATAQARESQAEARAEALRLQVRAEAAGLLNQLQARRQAAERYRTGALTAADQLARIAQVSYDAGERGILELLDALRSGASARIRQAALDAAVRQAEIELEVLTGWEMK
jgi:cobalt-zinc-cadmium efflux system outer membrane protein